MTLISAHTQTEKFVTFGDTHVLPQVLPQVEESSRVQEPPLLPAARITGGIRNVAQQHHPRGDPTGALERFLKLKVVLVTPDLNEIQADALVDTGAEVSIIKKGLVPDSLLMEAKQPLRLVAANSQTMQGGTMEVQVELRLQARNFDTREHLTVATPCVFYVAEMEEDLILANIWLGMRDMVVNPRQNGLSTTIDDQKIWIPGVTSNPRQRSNARLPWEPMRICAIPAEKLQPQKKMRALDLFCGRKSATKVLEAQGYQVESLDNDPKRAPSICVDVLNWEYKKFPRGYFDIIVASPPCTEYSAAKTVGIRHEHDVADPIVLKTLEIINYFSPPVWWVETPRNGRLTKKPFMQGLNFVDIDYCRFEDLGYKKPTRFYGGPHIKNLDNVFCDIYNCPGLVWDRIPTPSKPLHHRDHKGGSSGRVITEQACYIPPGVIEYVTGFAPPPPPWTDVPRVCVRNLKATPVQVEEELFELVSDPVMGKAVEEVRAMRISMQPLTAVIKGTPPAGR